jgi:CDP-4-dehydro-6-deoxyglucose reductase, E3
MPTPETFEAEILSTEALGPSVRSFVIERKDGRPLSFHPGQWINLVLPAPTGELRRAYSIASPPDGSARFEIAVTEVAGGPGSGFLCGLGPGTMLKGIGPQGFFTRDPHDAAPALFVATGTGVTPLRSMLLSALAAGSRSPLWLMLGVRREEDLLYRSQFEALAREHPNLRVIFTLSQGSDDWSGRRGYVQAHLQATWNELASLGSGDPHLYVCGLERMVTAVRQLAKTEMSLPRERVHSERYD